MIAKCSFCILEFFAESGLQVSGEILPYLQSLKYETRIELIRRINQKLPDCLVIDLKVLEYIAGEKIFFLVGSHGVDLGEWI